MVAAGHDSGSSQSAKETSWGGAGVRVLVASSLRKVVSKRGVSLRGACSQETLINPIFSTEDQALLDVLSLELTEPFVAGLTIEGEGARVIEDLGVQSNVIGIAIVDATGPITLRGVWVHHAVALGIGVGRSDVIMENSSVSDVGVTPAGTGGAGMYLVLQSTMTIERSYFTRNCFIGFGMKDVGTEVIARDIIVHASSPYPDDHPELAGSYGWGIQIFDGSKFDGERILSEANQGAGFVLSGPAPLPEANIRDVIIRGTKNDPNFINIYTWAGVEMGFGLEIWGGRMTMSRVLLEDNHTAGMVATETALPCSLAGLLCEETFVNATDLIIRNTKPDSRGFYGIGMAVLDGAEVTAQRVRVENNAYFGIGAWDGFRAAAESPTKLELKDVSVTKTIETEGSEGSFGDGITIAHGASASLENFVIEDNARVGLLVGGDSIGIEASGIFNKGVVRRNIIGVNLQTSELDFEASFSQVSSYENSLNLSQDEMNIPSFSLVSY